MRRILGRAVLLGGAVACIAAGLAVGLILVEGGQDDRHPAAAIVVLGASQRDGLPSPVFAARLDHAVALFRAGRAPLLVVTGGKSGADRTTEAAAARAYALVRGVPAEAILVEDRSRTTLESLRAVAGILAQNGIADAIFVSDPTHMLRVLLIANDLGIVAYGSPTRTSPIEAEPARLAGAVAHELGAIALYLLTERSR